MGLAPAPVSTRTFTVPVDSAGATAVSLVWLLYVIDVAALEPNITRASPTNPVPVIVTVLPPATGPEVGLTPVTLGAPNRYWSADEVALS
jgi:hypothetical protein